MRFLQDGNGEEQYGKVMEQLTLSQKKRPN